MDKIDTRVAWFRKQLDDHFESSEINNLIRILKEDLGKAFPISDKKKAKEIVTQLINRVPVQYITGLAPFYGYFFEVTPDVLIPRPETEELVYLAIKEIAQHPNHPSRVIDIGTGSGIIPITIGLECPTAQIEAIDVSAEALSVASRNGQKHEVDVTWRALNFLDQSTWKGLNDNYDLIISNPPYIPHQEKSLMHTNVLDHEPHLALFVDDKEPLIFYERLYQFGLSKLAPQGLILMECNEYNAQEVRNLFENDFETIVHKDMQGKDRMVTARRRAS